MALPDSQCHRPIKPVNVEDIVVFLDLKLFNYNSCYKFSSCRNAQGTFLEKPQLKIIHFPNHKYGYLNHTGSDTALQGSFVKRTCPRGSLEISSKVPLVLYNVKMKC